MTEVLRGSDEAATVKLATFAFVVEAGIVIVLELNAGLKLVNNVPVIGDPE